MHSAAGFSSGVVKTMTVLPGRMMSLPCSAPCHRQRRGGHTGKFLIGYLFETLQRLIEARYRTLLIPEFFLPFSDLTVLQIVRSCEISNRAFGAFFA